MITNRKIDLFCLFVFFPPQILDSSNTFKTGRTPVAGSSFCRFKPNWKRAGFMRILDSVDAWWSYVTSVDLIIFIMEPESRYIVQVNSKLSIYIYVSIELFKIMWLRWAHDTFRQLIRKIEKNPENKINKKVDTLLYTLVETCFPPPSPISLFRWWCVSRKCYVHSLSCSWHLARTFFSNSVVGHWRPTPWRMEPFILACNSWNTSDACMTQTENVNFWLTTAVW
jgi:hypothetical protein